MNVTTFIHEDEVNKGHGSNILVMEATFIDDAIESETFNQIWV